MEDTRIYVLRSALLSIDMRRLLEFYYMSFYTLPALIKKGV
jgi:hypothetical protein